MQTITLGTSSLTASRLAYGCWRLNGAPELRAAGKQAVVAAYETGYTIFDHADIYGGGEAEKIFGEVLRDVSGMRERILIVTKAGVRRADDPPGSPYHFNLSGEHIVRSCEGSLQRLGVETIDLFLLHRADWLADPADVAGAFTKLKQSGKVRFFGVSNFRPTHVTAIQSACPMPLMAHQVEISLGRLAALDDGTLDQCLAAKMTPMAWSPLGGGQFADGAKTAAEISGRLSHRGRAAVARRIREATRRDALRRGAGVAAETSFRHHAHRRFHQSPAHPRSRPRGGDFFEPRGMVSPVHRRARRAVAVNSFPYR